MKFVTEVSYWKMHYKLKRSDGNSEYTNF